MKRTVYLEIDEAYIPIFKSCGMMLSYDQFEELIRCKGCEFFQPFESSTEGMCIYAMTIKNANGFCDFAERKKE